MANPIVFDYATWIARYPEFANVSEPLAQSYFDEAGLYYANCGWTAAIPQARSLLYMLTAHIAWLNAPRDANGLPASTGQPASPIVGRLSSASEGSVSGSFEYDSSAGSPSEQWYTQTKYGAAFWAATAQFRTAVYVARPTGVPSTIFPYYGPLRGPRW